jgi:hypothetical protein
MQGKCSKRLKFLEPNQCRLHLRTGDSGIGTFARYESSGWAKSMSASWAGVDAGDSASTADVNLTNPSSSRPGVGASGQWLDGGVP